MPDEPVTVTRPTCVECGRPWLEPAERGQLCVKPTSDKRNASFRKRVMYAGLTYYCKR